MLASPRRERRGRERGARTLGLCIACVGVEQGEHLLEAQLAGPTPRQWRSWLFAMPIGFGALPLGRLTAL
jgi:hypothetical protein